MSRRVGRRMRRPSWRQTRRDGQGGDLVIELSMAVRSRTSRISTATLSRRLKPGQVLEITVPRGGEPVTLSSRWGPARSAWRIYLRNPAGRVLV